MRQPDEVTGQPMLGELSPHQHDEVTAGETVTPAVPPHPETPVVHGGLDEEDAAGANATDALLDIPVHAPQTSEPELTPPYGVAAAAVAAAEGAHAGASAAAEDEVIIADDLAEMIDVDEHGVAEVEPEPPKPKRSLPPPIPRG
jgi:hypothetical protein